MQPTRSAIISGALVLALALAATAHLLRAPLVTPLTPLLAKHRLAIDTAAGLPDGLHVGLGELLLQRWVAGGHRTPMPVHGPVGVAQVVEGLMLVYRQDQGYRVAHHGGATVPASGFGAQAKPFAKDDAGQPLVLLRDVDLVSLPAGSTEITLRSSF